MDIEIVNYSTLKKTNKEAFLPSEREHVTPFIYNSRKFKFKRKDLKKDLSKYRFCIDYRKDISLFCKLIDHFGKSIYNVKMMDLVEYVKKNPKLIKYKKSIKRNEVWTSV